MFRNSLLLIFLFIFNGIFPQTLNTVPVKVEVLMGSQPETRIRAINEGRARAVEKRCGVQIEKSGLIIDQLGISSFLEHLSQGYVVDDTITFVDIKKYRRSQVNIEAFYYLEMEVQVECVAAQSDPAFQVNVDLNKSKFFAGDELVIDVTATQDCYITVLNFAENGDLTVLHPSHFSKENFILAETTISIPSLVDRRAGIHIKMNNLPGFEENSEAIKVIATKKDISFLPILNKIDNPQRIKSTNEVDIYGPTNVAYNEFVRWLTKIPSDHRAEDTEVYKVYAK